MKVLLFLVLLLANAFVYAQNDAIKILEAQHALEQKNDCKGAKEALSEVTAKGQNQSNYIYYMAKTCDCLNEYALAMDYYNKYLQFAPNDTTTMKNIARLSYELRLQKRKKNLAGNWTGITNDGDTLAFTIEQKGDEVVIKQTEHPDRFFSGKYDGANKLIGKKYGIYWKTDSATFSDYTCKICVSSHTSEAYCEISEDYNNIILYNHAFFAKLHEEKPNVFSECCDIEEGTEYLDSWSLKRK